MSENSGAPFAGDPFGKDDPKVEDTGNKKWKKPSDKIDDKTPDSNLNDPKFAEVGGEPQFGLGDGPHVDNTLPIHPPPLETKDPVDLSGDKVIELTPEEQKALDEKVKKAKHDKWLAEHQEHIAKVTEAQGGRAIGDIPARETEPFHVAVQAMREHYVLEPK